MLGEQTFVVYSREERGQMLAVAGNSTMGLGTASSLMSLKTMRVAGSCVKSRGRNAAQPIGSHADSSASSGLTAAAAKVEV